MADVFVACSRAEHPFVRALHDTLARLNRDIRVDWEDIPPAAERLKGVYGGIESTGTFIPANRPGRPATTRTILS